MTAATTPETAGRFRHELVLHEGTAELVDLLTPFVRDGGAAGDAVVLVGESDVVDALRDRVADVPDLRVVQTSGRPRHPGRDLRRFQEVVGTLERTGALVRVVNQMPAISPGSGRSGAGTRRRPTSRSPTSVSGAPAPTTSPPSSPACGRSC